MLFRSVIASVLLLVLAGCDKQVSSNGQAEVAPNGTAPAAPAAAAPEASKIDRSHKGEAAPTLSFEDPAGKPTSLAAFKGKPLLVNLWATWCGPCVKEMPTLDQAAANIAVATISQDKDRPTVAAFFAKQKFTRLQPYLDKELGFSLAYNASLPMSILFDSTGHEVWRSTGGMDWTSAAAKAALGEAK
ncbi:TlpA family protein disulfide reductase [Sphingomonas sp. PAMC 26605]|uniref:TlpA family protein disulfide reductase n=1 Tax=Sphingomonas sp. PAMC 26605 TaxID=1112214 RepID=UPI00026CA6A1|nr:TlpA disulfide reductase family protein [Sphingomonas sp. PAMC 26605]